MRNVIAEELFTKLEVSEQVQFTENMRGRSGGCQAFQRLIFSLAWEDYKLNPMTEFNRLGPDSQVLAAKLFTLEFEHKMFYNFIGPDALRNEGYVMDEFDEVADEVGYDYNEHNPSNRAPWS